MVVFLVSSLFNHACSNCMVGSFINEDKCTGFLRLTKQIGSNRFLQNKVYASNFICGEWMCFKGVRQCLHIQHLLDFFNLGANGVGGVAQGVFATQRQWLTILPAKIGRNLLAQCWWRSIFSANEYATSRNIDILGQANRYSLASLSGLHFIIGILLISI